MFYMYFKSYFSDTEKSSVRVLRNCKIARSFGIALVLRKSSRAQKCSATLCRPHSSPVINGSTICLFLYNFMFHMSTYNMESRS